ncbi:MAB_1171c family putative transporter [Actinoplanes sp. NPDC026619]|uniref:MAB_1171c family putative transporter n=1 Tax=Actinoplanes sp. NPDC026619 TaxID=3155798 RepID=UPI0033F32D71
MAAAFKVTLFILLWGTVLLRIPTLRMGPKQRAMFLIFLCVAAATTMANTPIDAWVDRATGNRDWAVVARHMFGVLCAVSLLRLVSLITGSYLRVPRLRLSQQVVGALVAATLITLNLISGDGVRASPADVLQAGTFSPVVVSYWLTLEIYMAYVLTSATRLAWRVSKKSAPGLLQSGLRMVGLGTGLVLTYGLYKAGYLIAEISGLRLDQETVLTVADGIFKIALALMAIGVALPTAAMLATSLRIARLLRGLAPLWRVMRDRFPEIVLAHTWSPMPVSSPAALLHFRLNRRVIEIRDGMLKLREYVPAHIADDARRYLLDHGAVESRVPALVEACWMEVALRRQASHVVVKTKGSPGVEGGANVQEEANWLAQLTEAWRYSSWPGAFAWWWEEQCGTASEHGAEPAERLPDDAHHKS